LANLVISTSCVESASKAF